MKSFKRTIFPLFTAVFALCHLLGLPQVPAQPPGYWVQVDTTSAETLRQTIFETIGDHNRISYSAENWPILEEADADPSRPGHILDIYRNLSIPIGDTGEREYDREHVWPQSLGFPEGGSYSLYPRTDLHNLFLCDPPYNSSRGNNYFAYCQGCTERPTAFTNGIGGGSGVYPGYSNWRSTETWEVWIDRRGDAARAVMYMAARYNGGTNAFGSSEPDLRLTNNPSLITTTDGSVAYMGLLDDILSWHAEDPPDEKEIARHEVIADAQQNRNPFIDYPEWGACVFQNDCSSVAPIEPQNLVATNDGVDILLEWDARIEGNLTGYHVYRSLTSGSGYDRLTGDPISTTTFTDTTPLEGIPLYYVVTAANTRGLESPFSDEVVQVLDDKITIASQSFETASGYAINGATGEFGNSFFGRFSLSNPPPNLRTATAGVDGQYFIAGANTNGVSSDLPLPADGIHVITIDPVDVRGFAQLEVVLSLNANPANVYDSINNPAGNGDYLQVLVQLDESDDTLIGQFTKMGPDMGSNGRLGNDINLNGLGDEEIGDYSRLEDYHFAVPPGLGDGGTGDMLTVMIRTRFDANNEEIVYDNVRIMGVPVDSSPGSWFLLY